LKKNKILNMKINSNISCSSAVIIFNKILCVVSLLLLTITVNAHSVYVEADDNGNLIARFGQFGDDPETSPGYLDNLDCLTAWTFSSQDSPKSLMPTKEHDHFNLNLLSENGVEVQTGFPIMTRGTSPPRKPFFYARWLPNLSLTLKPSLTLDIVPSGEEGKMQVFFRNKPLPNIELTLYTPEGNEQTLESDDSGFARFKCDEKGLFMLKIGRYREERTGFDRGLLYQLVSHNCSVTWFVD